MKIEKIALQLYSVRRCFENEEMAKATFNKLKEIGYDQIQTAGNYGMSYEKFYELANEAGLEIIGTHDNYELMKRDAKKMIANTKILRTTNMGTGGFVVRSEEEVAGFIGFANEIAKELAKEGMKFTYHHHNHEFIRMANGKTAMDMLVEGLDPENVTFVLDTFWLQCAGADVRYWIKKLKGRVDILHLKDLKVVRDANGKAVAEMAHLGEGNINYDEIIPEAFDAGIKYFCVEQDNCPTDFEYDLKASADYLKAKFM